MWKCIGREGEASCTLQLPHQFSDFELEKKGAREWEAGIFWTIQHLISYILWLKAAKEIFVYIFRER